MSKGGKEEKGEVVSKQIWLGGSHLKGENESNSIIHWWGGSLGRKKLALNFKNFPESQRGRGRTALSVLRKQQGWEMPLTLI